MLQHSSARIPVEPDHADQGGRIFNTHGGGFWIFEPADLYAGMVAWNNQPDPEVDIAEIDTTFGKGVVFADWPRTPSPITAPSHGMASSATNVRKGRTRTSLSASP
jgi:hypothetical protein